MGQSLAEAVIEELSHRLSSIWYDRVGGGECDRLSRIPTPLNEFGVDPFGMEPDYVRKVLPVVRWLYRNYFRAEAFDIDKVPEGRSLLAANHSGQIPVDGMMVALAMLLDADPPRMVRSMVEKFVPTLPFVSTFLARCGQVVGLPENCTALLEHEEAILVFPEGVRGVSKVYRDRYQLQPFGHGFMRLALSCDTPIVPVAVIGAEEQAPSLHNSEALARLLGLPSFPITPTFPLLPFGLFPYPVKYRIYFGDPLYFEGEAHEERAEVTEKVEAVRGAIQSLLGRGLSKRQHIFW